MAEAGSRAYSLTGHRNFEEDEEEEEEAPHWGIFGTKLDFSDYVKVFLSKFIKHQRVSPL